MQATIKRFYIEQFLILVINHDEPLCAPHCFLNASVYYGGLKIIMQRYKLKHKKVGLDIQL